MRVSNRSNVHITAYSRFLVVILGLLQNTIAEDYLKQAIDGDVYIKERKFIDGLSKYTITKKTYILHST